MLKITICDSNTILDSSSFDMLNNYTTNSNKTLSDPKEYKKLVTFIKYNELLRIMSDLATNSSQYLIENFKRKIISCTFLGKECNFQSDFILFPNTQYLYCFKFNSDSKNPKTTSLSGPENGFDFSFYIGDQSSEITNKRGLKVYIDYQTESFPTRLIEVQPGVAANIALKRVLYQHLPYPYTNCITDLTVSNSKRTSVMEYMFKKLKISTYSFSLCQNVAFSLSLLQFCNCTDKIYLLSDALNICHTSQQIECMDTFIAKPTVDISASCPLGIVFNQSKF